jgi:hypothetical protein
MGTALSVAVVLLVYVACFAVFAAFVAGSIGLVGATNRAARQHGWPAWCRAAATAVAALATIFGAGIVFALIWPFLQLRKPRTPGTRRRLLYAAASLSVLLPSGCVAGSIAVGPCVFDPPPGDQLALTVVDDTPRAVTVVDCLDDACAEAQSPTTVAAGHRASMPLEGCAGGTMGVLGAGTDRLQSCISEPTEDADGNLRTVAVSEGRACAHDRNGTRVRVVDPGS